MTDRLSDASALDGERQRKWQLYLQHPDASPAELAEPLHYLIHPPSSLAPTASFIHFRDMTLLPMMQYRPEDPNLPLFLQQVEAVLAWRAGIAAESRFWKPDP